MYTTGYVRCLQDSAAGRGAPSFLKSLVRDKQELILVQPVIDVNEIIILAEVRAGNSPQYTWHWYACFLGCIDCKLKEDSLFPIKEQEPRDRLLES